jgi:hypothetical protein
MLLSFDVAAEVIEEHDRWHTHEHLPERLSIPGFLRGTRWIATEGGPRYMVVYEVEALDTLASEAYLARLNNPTPWTASMMQHYRGMARGLCAVLGSFGPGQGGAAALVRFDAGEAHAGPLNRWLLEEVLPAVPRMPGLGSAHLLKGAQAAAMTNEQRMRGADGRIDSALVVTGYDGDRVAAFVQELSRAGGGLLARGANGLGVATYRLGYSLARPELAG